jgi:hypothetical protein
MLNAHAGRDIWLIVYLDLVGLRFRENRRLKEERRGEDNSQIYNMFMLFIFR